MGRLWVIGLVALLLSTVLAWLLLAGKGSLPGGRAGRSARVARLGAALAASRVGAFFRRAVAGRGARERITEERRRAEATRIAEELGQMKGLITKVGQLVSFILGDTVPAEYRRALGTLRADAPPMDFALLRDMVETELGRPLERAFARFEPKPLAAASVGQVHLARLSTGEDVVVKIQYPGVAEAVGSDLAQAGILYGVVGRAYPGLDVTAFLDEVGKRFGEELDYRHEAACQRAFADLYDGHPFIRVPKVYPSHSTRRVLTTEFVRGRDFDNVASSADEADRSRYGEIVFRFLFGSSGRFGAFNADPHPGNYIFDGDGRIAFVDFGCVKFLEEDVLENWRQLDIAHLEGDRAEFFRLLVALNFCNADSGDPDLWYRLFAGSYEPLRRDEAFGFSREYYCAWITRSFQPKDPLAALLKKINRPADFVFVQRIQMGTFALLSDLRAKANWHRIYREVMLGGEVHGPLGEEEAEFRKTWLRARGLMQDDRSLRLEHVAQRGLPPEVSAEAGFDSVALTVRERRAGGGAVVTRVGVRSTAT